MSKFNFLNLRLWIIEELSEIGIHIGSFCRISQYGEPDLQPVQEFLNII